VTSLKPSSFHKYLAIGLVVFIKIVQENAKEHHMAIKLGVLIIMSFECSPYLWTNTADVQRITKKKRSTNKHAYDTSKNAILESKLMLVKFDPRLSFFTHTRGLS